jgi:predicted RNase H-like nuclease (RuvC/YqgF family)
MDEETEKYIEELASIADNGNPLAALILLGALADEVEKNRASCKDEKADNASVEKKRNSCKKEKPNNASVEKEKALTEELMKKDEKIKFLYDTISERDDEIAKLKKEIEKLRLLNAPAVADKEDSRYKKLEEQIEELRRKVEEKKNDNPLGYWRYVPGDEDAFICKSGGSHTSDSATK